MSNPNSRSPRSTFRKSRLASASALYSGGNVGALLSEHERIERAVDSRIVRQVDDYPRVLALLAEKS